MRGHTEEFEANVAEALHREGEYLAEGFYRAMDEALIVRFASAIARHLMHVDLPPYDGELLYPCSKPLYERPTALRWHYSSGMSLDAGVLQEKLDNCDDADAGRALEWIGETFEDYPAVGGYTHSIPNYEVILNVGLKSARLQIDRVDRRAEQRGEQGRRDFCQAMRIVLGGIDTLRQRAKKLVSEAAVEGEQANANQDMVTAVLSNVPMDWASTFPHAMVAYNFIMYLDGPDNPGRIDRALSTYYSVLMDREERAQELALAMIRQLWKNVDRCTAWNAAIGGLDEDGNSGITELTHLCVEAAEGMRRPNLALRLHKDAPDSIWDAALDCIATGCGLPALYNEEAYSEAIRKANLGVTEFDLADYAFGGCTELMIQGKSNVGSLEGNINLPQVLVDTLHKRLGSCGSFEGLVDAYNDDLTENIREHVDTWNENQRRKAEWQPQVMRSLLIDDCVKNGTEFNAGGAKYNWSVVNVMGLANVVDSLAAVREVVYQQEKVSEKELSRALEADFEGHEKLRRRLTNCPRFGNDNPRADDIAADISEYAFKELRTYAPWRGGKFIPACLMFTTYAQFGRPVGATPDGRKAGEPIADSAGAMQGRDTSGPTALFKSVTKMPHELAPGTLVVNVRFSKKYFSDPEQREKLRDLIETYFELGGMQLQINVVDQETLRDAYEHPEQYEDLIVRVGGYSEYWTRLDDDLRLSILKRVEHE